VCGIGGIIRAAGLLPEDRECAARLQRLLRHRGPDAEGTYRDRSCALVQTRLALIGPVDCPLPYASPDSRYIIVYNGEVYNFEELPFPAGTDTEVVLAAWIRWGKKALECLNGMFAFFIWDTLKQRGFGATDPLGIKPLFYHHSTQRFAFASEAGALIESGMVPFAPDEEAIAELLVAPYFSSATRLPFDGIKRLAPGHWIEVTRNRANVERYFRFKHTHGKVHGVDAFVDEVGKRVEDAVVASLRADVPVGVFLSGGVDSSLIATIAQSHCRDPVPCWTIAYRGQGAHRTHGAVDYSRSLIVKSNDWPFAERVAAVNGCAHSVVYVDDEAYDNALVRTLYSNDLICAWEQEMSQQLLAEAACKQVKAVLVGDAADETHFGYPFLLSADRIASPRHILEFFGTAPLRHTLVGEPVDYFTDKYETFATDRGYTWKKEYDQRLAMSCLIYHLWLTRLLHNGDIHLMSHSLEGRVPYGDTRLLALAQRLPQEIGYHDGIEKWHLRRAADRFLEPEIAWRPKSALTKNLHAHKTIHRHFVGAWRRLGGCIERYVDCDEVESLAAVTPKTEVDVGLCFRLLALMTWFERFSGGKR
jgi:asparagine synthase (glutamine-hydrolysing)